MVEQDDYVDEMLDDTHPPVVIAGIAFSASRILRELDPIAYDQCVADFYGTMDEEE